MSNSTTPDDESTDDQLTCDVTGCSQPAFVRVFPTHGATDDEALRCRECLEYDMSRDWFQDWEKQIRPDGGAIPRRFAADCDCGRRVTVTLPRSSQEIAADGTARVRCSGCETIVVVRADPPADERALRADGGHDPVEAAGAEAERAVAEHCGVPVADISVRHTRLSHPGTGIETLDRLVIEWVDRDEPPAAVVDELDSVTDIEVAPEDLVWTGDGYELSDTTGGVER